MTKAYQYDAGGYFAGEIEDHGLLPNNATHVPPAQNAGYVPRWNGTGWSRVENHKGKQGYIGSMPHSVAEYGPLPDGWSETPPLPTAKEARAARRAEINARLEEIDRESIRPLRAVTDGTSTACDMEKLRKLESEANSLRHEQTGLSEQA